MQNLSLYIHWPFCASKCRYCNFNSYAAHGMVDFGRWERAYHIEMKRLAEQLGPRTLVTLFFGGGTPSLMPTSLVGELIGLAHELWPPESLVEISLEANPSSSDAQKFQELRRVGVNRLSLGVQSLHDETLRWLGRRHTARQAMDSIACAHSIFSRVSFDLIYGHVGHRDPRAWADELSEAVDLAGTHLSLYELTYEPGTALWNERDHHILPEDTMVALFAMTQKLTREAGFLAYEVSNYARPDGECAHNLVYWRCGDYLGIGPGAHSRLSIGGERVALESIANPEQWLISVEGGNGGTILCESLTLTQQHEERLLMGLRLSEGVSLRDIAIKDDGGVFSSRIALLREQRLLSLASEHLILSEAGRLRMNAVINYLCTGRFSS